MSPKAKKPPKRGMKDLGSAAKNGEIELAATTDNGLRVPRVVFENCFEIVHLWTKARIKCSFLRGMTGKAEGYALAFPGWVPGTTLLVLFRNGVCQVVEATPDIKERESIPTGWMLPSDLEEQFSLGEYKTLVEALDQDPSPWDLGLAHALLNWDEIPKEELAVGMTKLSFGGQDVPFGAVLTPQKDLEAMRVDRVYNPENLPAPAEGTIMPLIVLQEGDGALQKLLKVCAGVLEGKYYRRYLAHRR